VRTTFLKSSKVLLPSILLVGFFLRAYQFSLDPPGLYFDEATIGYESFSLLRTGADRWGMPFPVYFVDWGSGQSVLYSYLTIPFVDLFGLSRFSVRLLSLFLGILTLPIMYVTVQRRLGA
jgi:4-amino-4-deoxy-L-arabinose transferase-like glycosyltransferase